MLLDENSDVHPHIDRNECVVNHPSLIKVGGLLVAIHPILRRSLLRQTSQTDFVPSSYPKDPPSYPNFTRFLSLPSIAIPVTPTEMTFSVSRDRGAFEWAGDTVFTVFCQRANLWRAAHWRMIWDVVRFNACARRLIEGGEGVLGKGRKEVSIGEYLVREGYSDSFRDDYLIVSAPWAHSFLLLSLAVSLTGLRLVSISL